MNSFGRTALAAVLLVVAITTTVHGQHQDQKATVREWTSDDTYGVVYALTSISVVALTLFLFLPQIQRWKVRRDVLENKDQVALQFNAAETIARSPDVKEGTRKKLVKLKDDFSSIDRLTTASKGIDWIEVRGRLESMDYSLAKFFGDMSREIGFAQEARRKGPELMKKIPGMIEAAEKKLAEGKQSPKAAGYLEEARTQYSQVQSSRSDEGAATNWVVPYILLMGVQENMANAESAHHFANSDHSSEHSAASYDSSSGFSDGGGYDSGGSNSATD